MPDLTKYQTTMNGLYMALRAAHKEHPQSTTLPVLHELMEAGAKILVADNPGLVVPDDGGGPKNG